MPPPPMRSPGIAIGTLNIQYGRGFGMALYIRAVNRSGFDVMLLIETKIQSEAYLHNRLRYNVTCLAARPSRSRGYQDGVGMGTMESPVGWGVDSMRYHGSNVVSCEFVTGPTQTPRVGAYLPPLMLENLPDLEDALQRFRNPIVLCGLNMDLDKVRSPRSQLVVDLLAEYGLIYLVLHFRYRCRFQNLNTWPQVHQVTVLQSRCDYILGTDWRRFDIVGIQDMSNFSLDHFALRARIIQCPTLCHACYLRGRRSLTLRPPPTAELIMDDAKFQTLKTLEPVPPKLKRPLAPYGCPNIPSG